MPQIIYSSQIGKDLFRIESNNYIYAYFISVFDSNTNETDVISCKFSKEEFVKAMKKLNINGKCSIISGDHSINFYPNTEKGYNIEMRTESRSLQFIDENFPPIAITGSIV